MPFRSCPRKLSSDQDLYAASLRALMRRGHSIHEMRKYLERRVDDKELVPPVIARLRELNYLDDARYALDYARNHAKLRRQGRFRIARELRGRGVPDRHIEAALAERPGESDEGAMVRTRLKRRIKFLRGPLDERRVASLYRSLLRAGFATDTIRRELDALTEHSVEDLPETTNEES